jgi:hypothetical protein
LFEFITF